jgi:hypothetical protein
VRWQSIVFVLLLGVLTLSACGGNDGADLQGNVPAAPTPVSGAVPWPAPPNALDLTRKAGLVPEMHEYLVYHVHAHLDVFVNGEPVVVPAGIGIEIDDPAVHHDVVEDGSDAYGGIDPPCAQACISPLHTHDVTGVIHTESKTPTPNVLGQLFTEWGVALDADCVGGYCEPEASIAVYVDGRVYEDDPATIDLTDRKEIAIVIGSPPAEIPNRFDF